MSDKDNFFSGELLKTLRTRMDTKVLPLWTFQSLQRPPSKASSTSHITCMQTIPRSTQVYHPKVRPSSTNSARLHLCCSKVDDVYINLKLNPDKTEFLMIGTACKRAELAQYFPIDLLVSLVTPSDNAKILGVTFDYNITFSGHVSAVCRACFIQIRALAHTRRYLNQASKRFS